MELIWLARERQEYLAQMLAHLRQISFSSCPTDLQRFLQETLTPNYHHPQPEVLCFLYDELNLQRSSQLLTMFSPVKSVAPR